jgi:hypothetical protein
VIQLISIDEELWKQPAKSNRIRYLCIYFNRFCETRLVMSVELYSEKSELSSAYAPQTVTDMSRKFLLSWTVIDMVRVLADD